jgi:hypothetical protein
VKISRREWTQKSSSEPFSEHDFCLHKFSGVLPFSVDERLTVACTSGFVFLVLAAVSETASAWVFKMKWITAQDLDHWADTIGARVTFPALVGDLIRASASRIDAFRFPSGDKGQVRGFDGSLVAEGAPPFVPDGLSIWEFGVNAGAAKKADNDYGKRVEDIAAIDRVNTTFVIVSPRTWDNPKEKLDDWSKAKRQTGDWRDVRYIDGVGLETWLESHPAVAARYARYQLGRFPQPGARSTDEFWDEYSTLFKPALTEEVLLCDRESQAEDLLRRLGGQTGDVVIAADSPDEVIAFAVAAIRKAKSEVRLYLEARTLVVDSEEAVRSLAGRPSLVFLLRAQARQKAGMLAKSAPTLVATGGDQPNRNYTTLARPSSTSMGRAISTMGYPDDRGYELARQCGRSVTILARLIPGGAAEPPEWLGHGTSLVPAVLAGSWTVNSALDKEILSELAGGRPYDEIETELRPLTRLQDPPIDRVDDVWKIRAPVDAFVHLGHLIGTQDLERFGRVLKKVFSQVEEPPKPDELYRLRPKVTVGCSEWLRDGLATTLLQISSLHAQANLVIPGSNPQRYVDDTIRTLPGLYSDHRVWASLRDELALLAEAAPSPLLSALEQMLEGGEPAIRPIFNEAEHIFAPSSPHTGLLWALEIMAWDPTLLQRATYALARLAAIDPGGQLTNRPINSLRAIFLSWAPNTNANLQQRMAALDFIIARMPAVVWDLLIKLVPKQHDTSSPTAKPRFKEAGGEERKPLTYGNVWQSQREIVSRALRLATGDADRLIAIVSAFGEFESELREQSLALVSAFLEDAQQEDRWRVWSALRDQANHHRAFADAEWALSQTELAKLDAVVARYQPDDPVDRLSWLFDEWAPDVPGKLDDPIDAVETVRRDAIQELLSTKEPGGILALSRRAKLPQSIAKPLVAISGDFDLYERVIVDSVGRGESLEWFAATLSGLALQKFDGAWSSRLDALAKREQWAPGVLTSLVLAWPDRRDTWDFVASFGQEAELDYWCRKHPVAIEGGVDDLEFAARWYMRVGRPIAALEALHMRVRDLSVDLIFDLLDDGISELNRRTSAVSNMVIYHLQQIFDSLNSRTGVSPIEIAKREYAYLPLLERRTGSMALHRMMVKDPEFYVSILCDVFKAATEEAAEVTEERRARATAGYKLLSSFHSLPGATEEGVDLNILREWVREVRDRARVADRAMIADQYIGHILAHAPLDTSDNAWPHSAIRVLLEELSSNEVERGLAIERFNMRGVFTKQIQEGGEQERALAEKYRGWARSMPNLPRTSALLEQIALDWDRQAERADIRSQQEQMKY